MFPLLGTPAQDKRLVVFPGVAHSCHDENVDLFVETVTDFVEDYVDGHRPQGADPGLLRLSRRSRLAEGVRGPPGRM